MIQRNVDAYYDTTVDGHRYSVTTWLRTTIDNDGLFNYSYLLHISL